MSLKLWVAVGQDIVVEGEDKLIYTWKVKSSVPQQKEWAYFLEANKPLWIADQELSVQRHLLVDEYRNGNPSKERCLQLKTGIDSLDALSTQINQKIQKRNLELLQKGTMTPIRVGILSDVANTIKWNKAEALRPAVEQLYAKLPGNLKSSVSGQEISLILYPPKQIKPGDLMADTLLSNIDGKSYHLADFKGKYILLDFWSFGCGPCHASVPEMKALHENLKDSLAIVSLSSDNKKIWKQATDYFKMTWFNLSDGNENRGIYARYGVEGIPNYVLINPEGIVKAAWTGYSEGSLKEKIKELTGFSIER